MPRLLRIALVLITLPWLAFTLALFLLFETPRGLAAAGWLFWLLPTLWCWAVRPRLAVISAVLLLGWLIYLTALLPRPAQLSGPVATTVGYPSLWDRLFNFVPESDLARVGVSLAYTGATRAHVLGLLQPLYEQIDADPSYKGLPHVVGSTARIF